MKNNKFFRRKYKNKHRRRRLCPTTYILGARCKDGVVLIGDRKVTSGAEPYTTKIRQLKIFKFIIFAAAGVPSLFEEFLEELPNRVIRTMNLIDKQNEKLELTKEQRYVYGNYNFRHDCVELLKEMKKTYSEIEEEISHEEALQVFFVQKEIKDRKPFSRLYHIDLLRCYPIPVDSKLVIGQGFLADVFLRAWNSGFTMRDTARLGSFIIKYIEREKLSPNDGVGVGNLQPQIWFFDDKDKEPREITDSELEGLLKGIDDEVERKIKEIGSRSTFLRS